MTQWPARARRRFQDLRHVLRGHEADLGDGLATARADVWRPWQRNANFRPGRSAHPPQNLPLLLSD